MIGPLFFFLNKRNSRWGVFGRVFDVRSISLETIVERSFENIFLFAINEIDVWSLDMEDSC